MSVCLPRYNSVRVGDIKGSISDYSSRSFVAPDGKQYKWRMKMGGCQVNATHIHALLCMQQVDVFSTHSYTSSMVRNLNLSLRKHSGNSQMCSRERNQLWRLRTVYSPFWISLSLHGSTSRTNIKGGWLLPRLRADLHVVLCLYSLTSVPQRPPIIATKSMPVLPLYTIQCKLCNDQMQCHSLSGTLKFG